MISPAVSCRIFCHPHPIPVKLKTQLCCYRGWVKFAVRSPRSGEPLSSQSLVTGDPRPRAKLKLVFENYVIFRRHHNSDFVYCYPVKRKKVEWTSKYFIITELRSRCCACVTSKAPSDIFIAQINVVNSTGFKRVPTGHEKSWNSSFDFSGPEKS